MRVEIEEDLTLLTMSPAEHDEEVRRRLFAAGIDLEKPIHIVGQNAMTRSWVFEGERRADQ